MRSAARRTRSSWACSARCGPSTAPTSTRGSLLGRLPSSGRAACWSGPARTPARSTSATGWPSSSRSSRTTIRAPWSRTRGPPPAWAASSATSSPWARGRSRSSTACASGRSTPTPRPMRQAAARNRYLFGGVVGGIAGYGNCIGIPDVGGEITFDASYSGNPLVNAMCVGIARHDEITLARAAGAGQRPAAGRGVDRARRNPGRVVRVGHARRRSRGATARGPGRQPVPREAAHGGMPRAGAPGRRGRHAGPRRGRADLRAGRAHGARRRRRRRRPRRRPAARARA